MANAVSMMDTDAVRDAARAGCSAPVAHAATVPRYVAAPASGTVNERLPTCAPAASVSTVCHDPRVNLNSTGPRTDSGRVSAYPPASARSRYAASPGFHALNEPAT